MDIHKTGEIFVPGGMPLHTYISRSSKGLEEKLSLAKDNLCKLVTVTGPTKSGKTVLTNKIYPKTSSVWVDGGTIRSEDDLWSSIIDAVDGYTQISHTKSSETSVNILAKIRAKLRAVFIGGEGEFGGGITKKNVKATQTARSISLPSSAVYQLRNSGLPLIMDDFHYLNRKIQGNVIRALKPLIFEGLPVVLIAIPHRRYDAVKVEKEMTGRLEQIEIPTWEIDELKEIASEGFPLLNIELHENICNRFAEEAIGSPHLMQEFCKEIANENEISKTSKKRVSISNLDDNLFKKVAVDTGKVIFDRLAKGPRQRSDRIQRALKSGKKVDIYKVILYALAKLGPGMDTIEYEQLRGKIREILSDNVPQANEVTRVLEKMAEIATTDEASTPVIDWEKEEQKLHITDPFFAFYLKWGVEIENI